jgi:hypothetical protein
VDLLIPSHQSRLKTLGPNFERALPSQHTSAIPLDPVHPINAEPQQRHRPPNLFLEHHPANAIHHKSTWLAAKVGFCNNIIASHLF